MKRVTSSIRVQWDAKGFVETVLRRQAGLRPRSWRGVPPMWTSPIRWAGRKCNIPSEVLGRAIWTGARF